MLWAEAKKKSRESALTNEPQPRDISALEMV